AAALFKLRIKPVRGDLGRTVEDDHVIRRVIRVSIGGSGSLKSDVTKAELTQNFIRSGHLGRITFGRNYLSGKSRDHGCDISGRRARHKDIVRLLDLGGLQQLCDYRRLDQEALRRRTFGKIEIE